MALADTDLFALYKISDQSNRKASLAQITSYVNQTTASNLQEVTDNGNTTTNSLVTVQRGAADDGLVVKLVDTETFWVTGAGFVECTGDLLVNNRSGIAQTGVVTAYRTTTTGTDVLQNWQSNVGATPNTVANITADGTLNAVAFVGDGSGLTGLPEAANTLQEVCDNGNVTTTGAQFGTGFAIGTAPTAKALEVTGDSNLTGALDVSGATAVGSLISNGAILASDGPITSDRAASGDVCFEAQVSSVTKASIYANGSAVFSGSNIVFYESGAADYTSTVTSNCATATDASFLAELGGVEKAKITAGGVSSAVTIENTVPLDSWDDIPNLP